MKKKHDQANPPTPPKPTDRAYINEPKGYLSTPIWGIGPNQKNQKEKKKKKLHQAYGPCWRGRHQP